MVLVNDALLICLNCLKEGCVNYCRLLSLEIIVDVSWMLPAMGILT